MLVGDSGPAPRKLRIGDPGLLDSSVLDCIDVLVPTLAVLPEFVSVERCVSLARRAGGRWDVGSLWTALTGAALPALPAEGGGDGRNLALPGVVGLRGLGSLRLQ